MYLRKLKVEDAPLMLEWMHDSDVTKDMMANFSSKTLNDCISFIEKTLTDNQNLHLAIVDENDIYMGTVSLKNITDKDAEFAITIRSIAMGKGFSKYGMNEIIRIGLEELHLNQVYWYVSVKNERAIRFYDKNRFKRINPESLNSIVNINFLNKEDYIWYVAD